MLHAFGTLYLAADLYDAGEFAKYPVFSALGGLWLLLFQIPRLRMPVFGLFLLTSSWRLLEGIPDLPNHSNFILLTHLILGVLWVRALVTRTDLETSLRASEDLLRWCLLLVYAGAALHKINADFLNPEASCAVDFLAWAGHLWLGGRPVPLWLTALAPPVVLAWEIVIPIFLLIPRVQWLGVALAYALHAFAAPINFVDFATVGTAFLYLYLPAAARSEVYEGTRSRRSPLLGYALLACIYPWETLIITSWFDGVEAMRRVQGIHFVVAAGVLLVPLAVHLARTRRWDPVPMFPALRNPYKVTPLVALLLFILTPYMGLRTAGNFSMFSNLVIWAPRYNHFLIPANVKLFDYADDLVWFDYVDRRVRRSHRDAPSEAEALPAIELKKLVATWKEEGLESVRMRIRYRGEKHSFSDITRSEEWSTMPWWQRRLLDFRLVQETGPNYCRW